MAKNETAVTEAWSDEPAGRIAKALPDLVSQIPDTSELPSANPIDRVHAIAENAALRTSIVSGSLALPLGPLGLLTLIPDLVSIWKIQAQMVADIAGAFGKKAYLDREQMLYCLFRHAASQAVCALVVGVGERILVRRVTLRTLESITRQVGMRVTQRLIAKSVSRWLPIVGALGVAAYAYYDTTQVASTAIELFQKEIDIEEREPNAA